MCVCVCVRVRVRVRVRVCVTERVSVGVCEFVCVYNVCVHVFQHQSKQYCSKRPC